nr:14334_t:CDS:2 [Entrophospora candida]
MPHNPNQGPCLVTGCENSGPYRNFNKTVYTKSINSGTFSNFDYLIVNESQLCFPHYLQVCEPAKGKKCIAFENKNINEQNNIFAIKNLLDNLNNQNTIYMLQPDQVNPPFSKKSPLYYLASLNYIVDIKCLPTGYHTSCIPSLNICDHCKEAFSNNIDDVIVLVCEHDHHLTCYNTSERVCRYCENYYKKGIDENIKKLSNFHSKNSNILNHYDGSNDNANANNQNLDFRKTELTVSTTTKNFNTELIASKKENEIWLKTPKTFIENHVKDPIKWESFGPDENKLHRALISAEINGKIIVSRGDAKTKKDSSKFAYLNLCYSIESMGLMNYLLELKRSNQSLNSNLSDIDSTKHVIEYCARFDHVPKFQVFQLNSDQNNNDSWEAVIELPSQGLIGRGHGKTIKEAEIMAANDFKNYAEEYMALHGADFLSTSEANIMTEDMAKKFINFYCRYYKLRSPEFKFTTLGPDHSLLWEASLFTANNFLGKGQGSNKRTSQIAAYLDSAIFLRKDFPKIWEMFDQDKLNAKLKPTRPLDIKMNDEVFNKLYSLNYKWITEKSTKLYEAYQNYLHSRQSQKILLIRQQLPITSFADTILNTIDQNPVTVIVGSTGCGKTTQLPQLILENAIREKQGAKCNIIVTQPRRIAAVSVAQRVAYERSEKIGQSIGYQVRFESVVPSYGGSILYCTTGIFLRKMHEIKDGKNLLNDISHIIVDEVHERDMDTDFLLVILKQILKASLENNLPPIKIILMSATVDTGIFSNYFGELFPNKKCPVIKIPGKIYPVKHYFLDDIIPLLHSSYNHLELTRLDHKDSQKYIDREMRIPKQKNNNIHYSPLPNNLSSSKMSFQRKILTSNSMDIDNGDVENEIDDTASRGSSSSGYIDWSNSKHNDEILDAEIPYNLMALVIAHIVKSSKEGSILVFLPGWDEIMSLSKQLTTSPYPLGINFSDQNSFKIHMLHSSLPTISQQEVFDPLPSSNMRKIILATNIAETSITIPDIVYVVDSGKLKENRYDQSKHMTNLTTTWISQSNSRQRAGRAGRTCEGEYYTIMSRTRYQNIEEFSTPEMLRSDLQGICLHIKALDLPSKIEEVLAQAIQPPDHTSVTAALDNLKLLQALNSNEELTPLGKVLATLPLEPGLGKMVLLGAIFQCLDPILTIAASMTCKNPFYSPIQAKERADEIKAQWAQGTSSDHLAILNAYKAWYEVHRTGGYYVINKFCSDNFLSRTGLQTIEQIKIQLLNLLQKAKVIPKYHQDREYKSSRTFILGPPEYNVNSKCISLIKALICAGVSPNISLKTSKKTYRTKHENLTFVHPASVNYKGRAAKMVIVNNIRNNCTSDSYNHNNFEADEGLTVLSGTLFVYSNKIKTNGQVYLHDTTCIDPFSVIIFGGEVNIKGIQNNLILTIDDWLHFNDDEKTINLIINLKYLLEQSLTKLYEQLGVEEDYNNNRSYNYGIVDRLNTDDEMCKLKLVIKGVVELLELLDKFQDLSLHRN